MRRIFRIALRLLSLVAALSAVLIVLSVAFVYMLADANARAPSTGYNLTTQTLERTALGLYLRLRAADLASPVNPDDSTSHDFTVAEGESINSVADRLLQVGIIIDSDLFRRYVQYAGTDVDIQAGSFVLRANMTIDEVMRELQHGMKTSVTVTIREGLRAEEIAFILEQAGVVSAQEFLDVVQQGTVEAPFIGDRPEGAPSSLEGFLFPDTYNLSKNANARDVVMVMLNNWQTRVPADLRARAGRQGLSLYRTVILASIVEREARVPDERPVIAGVYINRLNQSMPLQADPTVQYAKGYDSLTREWWPQLLQKDLQATQSPFNTYLHPGLPPTPICNPGLASIQAALNPQGSDYLYFYAKGDGSHAFATTFEEHLANIERFYSP
ncbi:MAG: endolytic transglycosylase MltG [Anaerolineae bacterium]